MHSMFLRLARSFRSAGKLRNDNSLRRCLVDMMKLGIVMAEQRQVMRVRQ
ncbi:hypothetical protein QW131_12400 [Roseibium salinum]|nr:hypothetical protein [Roseibium salinum]